MAQKISWGIIGAGAIAQAFARGAAGSRTATLLAVASREQAKAEKFGDEFKVPRRYGSYEALLADRDVQAVYICTPHPMHAEWALKAIEAGKHVLVEKPMCVTSWDASAIFEAAEVKKVMAMEAFMYRCHPQTAKLVELIKEKAIGDVKLIQATFGFGAGFNPESRLFKNELAGGGILDVGCYAVSMARLVAGAAQGKDFADPVDVKAVGSLTPTAVDSYAAAVLKFPGEIVAQVATAVTVGLENVVRIFGSAGNIFVPNPWVANRKEADTGKIIVNKAGQKEPQEITVTAPGSSFQLEIDVFGDAVLAGKIQAPAPAMSWGDTLGNLQTLDKWRESMGQSYVLEKPEAFRKTTISGKALSVNPKNNMKYGQIPGLQKQVSRLIFGCDNQRSLSHMALMSDAFFEAGGNTWDTAFIYGGGIMEQLLGQWIKLRGVRDQINVIVKGAHTPACNPKDLSAQLIKSLERLQIDSADLYIMHRDNLEIPVSEFVDVLNEHKKAGRLKVFGGSNWSLQRVQAANDYAKSKGLQGFSLVNNNFSLARMVNPVWGGCIACSDPESRAWLTQNQIANLSWSSQARGFFVPGRAAPDKLEDKELTHAWYSEDNFKRQARAIEVAKKYNVEPISIALAYVLCQPFPSFALIGPRSLSELRTSLPGLNIQLSPSELKYLNLESDKI